MNDTTPTTTAAQPNEQPKAINMDLVALRLGDKAFCVSRKGLRWSRYIREILNRADEQVLGAPGDLPWGDRVAPETMEWFLKLLSDLYDNSHDIRSVTIYGPEENRLECLAALPRLQELAELLGCADIPVLVRRTGVKIIRQIHVPQDTDADLKQSVRLFDAAYRAWSDTLVKQWIFMKFCKVVNDIPHAISLEPAISDEFREKALAYHQKSSVEHNVDVTDAIFGV
ncbi:hypothetical protein PG997_006897 [Apiospora hydei]|uniref:BTB domain-containing protein n=1 Tax=Apiospora hydei TaxID=1337664 RepID=A0ABR1WRX1_9PEZI